MTQEVNHLSTLLEAAEVAAATLERAVDMDVPLAEMSLSELRGAIAKARPSVVAFPDLLKVAQVIEAAYIEPEPKYFHTLVNELADGLSRDPKRPGGRSGAFADLLIRALDTASGTVGSNAQSSDSSVAEPQDSLTTVLLEALEAMVETYGDEAMPALFQAKDALAKARGAA